MNRIRPVRTDARARGPLHAVRRHPVIALMLAVAAGAFVFLVVKLIPVFSLGATSITVTLYEAGGVSTADDVVVTVSRVTRHPRTRLRLEGAGASRFSDRIEFIQIDGLLALKPGAPVALAVSGDAVFTNDRGDALARPIRTAGNSCEAAGWPRAAMPIVKTPGRFTVRVPVAGSAVGHWLLEEIGRGRLPAFTFESLHPLSSSDCAPLDGPGSGASYGIEVGPTGLGPGVKAAFFPFGAPRYAETGPGGLPFWREWVGGLEYGAFR